jgi:iron complex outermembrane receptor protein
MNLFNVYGQDEIELVRKRLSLTVGTKIEHNDFTGFEIEPSARLKWTPTANQTVWAAVSRAVSTPSRSAHDNRVNAQAFPTNSTVALVSLLGNPDLQSESVLAYELGYRLQPHPRLWFDVATFYNTYDHLLGVEPGSPSPEGSHLLIPFTADDNLDGESYGTEVTARWQAAAWWRLDATYSYTQIELHPTHGSQDTIGTEAEGKSPRHQVMVRSALDFPRHIQFDTMARFVDDLPSVGIPSYFSLDVRLGWQPTPNLDLSLVGQNLLDDHHPEFAQSTFTQATEVPRGVYGKVTWRY